MKDVLTEIKYYAPVKVAEEKCASFAGFKSVRFLQEWIRNGSCTKDRDEILNKMVMNN